jgi:steroid 5-alpha reductase family enzyme
MKDKHFIDSHKAVTGLYILLLMAYFHQWNNVTLWVYLALHGTYGLLWVFKSWLFPDKQWNQPASLVRGIMLWIGLTGYWIAPFIIAARNVQAPYWVLALAVFLNIVGTMFHFASDMQKYTELKIKPNHLITDGFWRLSRNPNYFGEFLIYSSFALLALHWLPWVVLGIIIVGFWIPHMWNKDKSISRYAEFRDYKAHTRSFFPFLF